jgi:hypothetical protein
MNIWYNDILKNDSSFKDKLEAIRSVKKIHWWIELIASNLYQWVDPARPGQKLDCNPLTFVFLLKRCRFDFFKKKWPGRPGQNPEPEPWTEPGLKTMIVTMFWIIFLKLNWILIVAVESK